MGFYAQLFSDLLVSLVVLEHFLFIDFRERERERERDQFVVPLTDAFVG